MTTHTDHHDHNNHSKYYACKLDDGKVGISVEDPLSLKNGGMLCVCVKD